MQITIFNLENNSCQTTFQVYRSGDAGDKQGFEMMKEPVHLKNLN